MADPVGLIGVGGVSPVRGAGAAPRVQKADPEGPSFRDVFMDTLRQADRLQQDATQAAEDLAVGRGNPEDVILAAQKAETAFKMIQSLRNKVMQAYDENTQMRV